MPRIVVMARVPELPHREVRQRKYIDAPFGVERLPGIKKAQVGWLHSCTRLIVGMKVIVWIYTRPVVNRATIVEK